VQWNCPIYVEERVLEEVSKPGGEASGFNPEEESGGEGPSEEEGPEGEEEPGT
jgi:hypothetical protein